MLHLEKIDHRNVWDVLELKVFQKQKSFVADNGISLIQAYSVRDSAETAAFPFAVYDGKRPVGFLMIGFNEAALYEADEDCEAPTALVNNYSLWRLMIDKRYQGRGYGRQAVQLALDFVRTWPCGKAEYCEVSYEPENEVAAKLYHSFGFTENGEHDGDEIVAVLKL
ncbi:MAG: GNAT family N-acetyltransferase [Oscillospiraceae bacterium]|nr:GNAT family N-acetyltransferase [Oscillospiraceae bacterium]